MSSDVGQPAEVRRGAGPAAVRGGRRREQADHGAAGQRRPRPGGRSGRPRPAPTRRSRPGRAAHRPATAAGRPGSGRAGTAAAGPPRRGRRAGSPRPRRCREHDHPDQAAGPDAEQGAGQDLVGPDHRLAARPTGPAAARRASSSGDAVTTGNGSLPSRTASSGASPMPATSTTTTIDCRAGRAQDRSDQRAEQTQRGHGATGHEDPQAVADRHRPDHRRQQQRSRPTSTWPGPEPSVSSAPAAVAYGSANPAAAAPATPSPAARDSSAPVPSRIAAMPAAARPASPTRSAGTPSSSSPRPVSRSSPAATSANDRVAAASQARPCGAGSGGDLLDDVVVRRLGPDQVARHQVEDVAVAYPLDGQRGVAGETGPVAAAQDPAARGERRRAGVLGTTSPARRSTSGSSSASGT